VHGCLNSYWRILCANPVAVRNRVVNGPTCKSAGGPSPELCVDDCRYETHTDTTAVVCRLVLLVPSQYNRYVL